MTQHNTGSFDVERNTVAKYMFGVEDYHFGGFRARRVGPASNRESAPAQAGRLARLAPPRPQLRPAQRSFRRGAASPRAPRRNPRTRAPRKTFARLSFPPSRADRSCPRSFRRESAGRLVCSHVCVSDRKDLGRGAARSPVSNSLCRASPEELRARRKGARFFRLRSGGLSPGALPLWI